MMNPLLLEFCLWLLKTSNLMSSSFLEIKKNQEKVREILVTYIANRVDSKYFSVEDIGPKFGLDFPVFDPKPDDTEINQMLVDLLKDVLSRCSKIEVLALWNYHPVKGLLSAVNPRLYTQINTLVLEVSGSMTNRQFSGNRRSLKSATPRNPCPTGIHVEIYDAFSEPHGCIFKMLKAAMRYCSRTGRPANVYLILGGDSSVELSTIVHNDMHGLHLDCGRGFAHCELDIPPCPTLRYLSITHLINADNVLKALFKAVLTGHIPKLNYLDISCCSFQTTLDFPVQFPSLESLILLGVKGIALQSINKLKTLRSLGLSRGSFGAIQTAEDLFVNSWDTLTSFSLYDINPRIWTVFVQAVNKGKLANLRELRLSIDAASAAAAADEIVTLFTNVSFLDYHGEIPYRWRDSHKHRIPKSMITIYELEAGKLPYLKSLTLIGRTIVFDENQ